jgi:hypothetical protein
MRSWKWSGCLVGMVLAGCAGGAEKRISALEAEVAALRQEQTATAETVTRLKQETDKSVGDLQQSQQSLDGTITALMKQVAGLAAGTPAPAATASTQSAPSGPSSDAEPWLLAGEVAGLPEPAPKLDGDVYRVSRAWLVVSLRQAALGKPPFKLAADKKTGGVSVKGVKARSFLELLGLHSNDVVLEVGGKPTPGPAELVAALHGGPTPLKVKLQRKGAELVLRYTLTD